MSTENELAEWGEPPATDAENRIGAMLDCVMAEIERSGSLAPAASAGNAGPAAQLVGLLYECAAGVRESLNRDEADPRGADRAPNPGLGTEDVPNPLPGEYRFRMLLGRGGCGEVWLADDIGMGRQVAVKTITDVDRLDLIKTLRNEAKLLGGLEHPNIVRVFAWREVGSHCFLVMRYVPGGSLADQLKGGNPLPWPDAARYVADVGEALAAAHRHGVIHRDVKPSNILLDAVLHEAVLTDFGISARMTDPTGVAGTPLYMAPEAFGGPGSAAGDVYGLAATLYHLATGAVPFDAPSLPILFESKLRGLPEPDERCRSVPEPLERLIRSGLNPDPERRPPMAEFVSALRTVLNQLLADALVPASAAPSAIANLSITLRRRVGGTYESLDAITHRAVQGTRNMKKVPMVPDRVILHTGDRVRIEAVVNRAGYLAVFNIGPMGHLEPLFPDSTPRDAGGRVEAGRPVHIADVEMTPPTGRERLVAVWSELSLPLDLHELARAIEHANPPTSRAYRTTRNMKKIQETVARLKQPWQALVIELDHV